jgi:hypothetical protein
MSTYDRERIYQTAIKQLAVDQSRLPYREVAVEQDRLVAKRVVESIATMRSPNCPEWMR